MASLTQRVQNGHSRPERALHAGRAKDPEADHRIGNSLAFLSAALRYESSKINSLETARLALLSSANRINAIARVHFALARNDGDGTIPLEPYLTELATDLSDGLGIQIEALCDGVIVSTDLAGGLAVVLSELVTNAVKHAGKSRTVSVFVAATADGDDRLKIVVGDNGDGLPSGFEITNSTGLGMTIITSTIERLNGTVTVESGPGAIFRIELPC